MIIKRVGVDSLATIVATVYAVFGLVSGAILSIVALAGYDLGGSSDAMVGAVVGPFAIILLPIVYALLGYIGGTIGGWVFNYAAATWGGLEIEVEQDDERTAG